MASSIAKRPCSKCDKGVGILTCDGCQQSFCAKHITDHRQELSIEMDNIGQEYDLLQRDLCRENNELNPLLNRINDWEQESIKKIQQIAQQTRNDLQGYLDQNKNEIKNLSKKLANELQSSRESGDYTEIDFKLWTEQLTELRKSLEKPLIIDIIDDNKTSIPIHMIKLQEKTNVYNSPICVRSSNQNILTSRPATVSIPEKFSQFIGNATFSYNNLVATHSGEPHRSTMVYITQLYSSGIYRIRFRIEQNNSKYLFFGIVNSHEEMNRIVFKSPSLYGWMAPNMRVVKSRKLGSNNINEKFTENDEISLILNNNIQQLSLEHNRTNMTDRLSIDSRVCPLPWRIVVAFFSRYDSVRIIH